MSPLPPCIGISGWKNSGKTTLVASLVKELSDRGFIVSTIKHAHHSFDLDQSGTDSFKHREAGAKEVILASGKRWAIQHELAGDEEPSLTDLLRKASACDLVLFEGFKREAFPKIEIIGTDNPDDHLWPEDKNIIALACDFQVSGCDLPRFERSQVSDIADFIVKYHGLNR